MTAALVTIPGFTASQLSDDERDLVGRLRKQMVDDQGDLQMLDDYYNGVQRMTNMGVSLPPELEGTRAVMGWPRLAADAPNERLDVEGFRYPDELDADEQLWDVWQRSNLDEQSGMAHLDALVFGRSFVVVGTEDDGSPLVTVESPLTMTALWDPRTRHLRAALQCYDNADGEPMAALYLPDQTITMTRSTRGGRSVRGWEVAEARDEHRMGWVPAMMMSNRGRTHQPYGCSEITESVRHLTDAACRTLLDLEISREFYAAPQRYILGATEEAFQDSRGNPKSAWETYRGRVLALERGEGGELPQVGQFTPYDPSAYTTVLNTYATHIASELGLPPSYLGLTTDQPASADAIRMSTDRLVNRVRRKQRSFEQAWEGAMRMALAFRDGAIPDPARRIETIWRNPEIPTPAATTDAVQKQVAMGYMPATSDVAGEVLGYSPLQRDRIARERPRAEGSAALEAITRRLGTNVAAAAVPATQDGTDAAPSS